MKKNTQSGSEGVSADASGAETTPKVSPLYFDRADFDAIEALLRLLVGGAVEGAHELAERLRLWEEVARDEISNSDEDLDHLGRRFRYLLIGMLFDGQAWSRQTARDFMSYPKARTQALSRQIDGLGGSRLLRTFLKPFIGGFQKWSRRQLAAFERQIDNWVELGRRQERQGRIVARLAATELVGDSIERLAESEALAELVSTQGVGLVGGFVENVREVSVTADTLIERIVYRILNREPRQPRMSDASAESPPSSDEEVA